MKRLLLLISLCANTWQPAMAFDVLSTDRAPIVGHSGITAKIEVYPDGYMTGQRWDISVDQNQLGGRDMVIRIGEKSARLSKDLVDALFLERLILDNLSDMPINVETIPFSTQAPPIKDYIPEYPGAIQFDNMPDSAKLNDLPAGTKAISKGNGTFMLYSDPQVELYSSAPQEIK